jgi:hypothetical protein
MSTMPVVVHCSTGLGSKHGACREQGKKAIVTHRSTKDSHL